MVILTITKIRSDVNDFQNSINILLIIHNLVFAFLGKLIAANLRIRIFLFQGKCKVYYLYTKLRFSLSIHHCRKLVYRSLQGHIYKMYSNNCRKHVNIFCFYKYSYAV